MGYPSAEDFSRSQWTTALDATTRKAISGSIATLGPMVAGGVYFLRSDAAAFFLQGAVGVTCTSSTGHPIFAQEGVRIYCDDATNNGYVGVITSGGTGVAYLARVL